MFKRTVLHKYLDQDNQNYPYVRYRQITAIDIPRIHHPLRDRMSFTVQKSIPRILRILCAKYETTGTQVAQIAGF